MRYAILAAAMLWLMSAQAGGQCCGDCNGDGVVSINELITAVSNSLEGCVRATPTPQPTATATELPTATATPRNVCPFDFEDQGAVCTFRGRYNQGCGAELLSGVINTGLQLRIEIATQVEPQSLVVFEAQVTGPTSADLTGWFTNISPTVNPLAGQVSLLAGGEQLVIFPNDPPFMIQGCNFVRYSGNFVGNALAANDGSEATGQTGARTPQPIPNLGSE